VRVRPSQRTLWGVYYVAVLALILVGVILWSTGHGTGDPYLTLGFALAFVPVVVIWLRPKLSRD
jgi:peptidoglycan/LPS O-acetylase OafA/YrhL